MSQVVLVALISLGFTARTLTAETPTPRVAGGVEEGDRGRVHEVQFNRDIRPILSDNCFACHGFDPKKRKAGLRLDVAEGAVAPAKSGRVAIRPGDPEGSELWRRLEATDPDELMPPASSHKTLTSAQKSLVRRWILEGASYQKHWAFEPPVRTEPPEAKTPGWGSHPIDRFLSAAFVREGLNANPEADRRTLIRRLSFDLTGLPPTSAEVEVFVSDLGEGAYERVVDRLLSSPRYGEQMGRHWLDVARYADTHGLHLDNERQIWPYRDWVVRAFNRNQPFDRFTIEQLAGDLLPSPTQEQLIATGFNRNNVTTSEGGSIDAEFVYRYAVERTSTTVQAWLGLTAGCAVCHDHKYDPITMKEFYSLYSFFNNAADPAMDGNDLRTPPVLRLKTAADEARLAEFDARVAEVEAKITKQVAEVVYVDPGTLTPPPEAKAVETVWADDGLPEGWKIAASPGAPTRQVKRGEGQPEPYSGDRAWVRQDKGLAQDVAESGASPLVVPTGARLFAYVRLDPADLPKAIMLQYRTGDWRHRAVWGDYEVIDWGAKGTTERVHQGGLPKAGEWVRLEFEASVVGLKAGDKITGFAWTQHGGTVAWDKVGILGVVDPARDPARSMLAWVKSNEGKPAKELPEAVRKIFEEPPAGERTAEQSSRLRAYYLSRVCAETRPGFDPWLAELEKIRKERGQYEGAIPVTFVWRDRDQPRESFVMERGAYDRPGERVTPGVPAALPPLTTSGTPTRLDLAEWLVDPANPLTARVAVNRFWQQFFGYGLVRSADDFGSQGEPPSHPALLDWLAVTFRESGWNVKQLVRLMVTSRAYRQSSQVRPEALEKDPANRWLARSPRFRLDAEQIRDNALYVSGLLVPDMGGKGVKTYQPPNIWEPVGFVGSNTREYRQDSGPSLYRRSLYTFLKRTAPAPFLSTFDAPNREQFCTRRERSNTPLQALQLMNDVQHFEAARSLAERMLTEGGSSVEGRIEFGYRTVLARPPLPEESAVVRRALEQHLERYAAAPEAARRVVAVGESKPRRGLAATELAAYTLTANLLLNLDETVTRN